MNTNKAPGFTIVELLIVIVIIAILAVVTTVAFNGVQRQAKISVLQSNVASTLRYLKSQQVIAGDYPTSVTSNDGVIYELTVNNTSSPKTFCLTATMSGLSYKTTDSDASPSEGLCPGHTGSGAPIISNLVPNPSFEVDNSGWSSTRTDAVVTAGAGQSGGKVLRVTVNNVGYFPRVYITNSQAPAITTGKTYRVSAWIKSSSPVVLLAQPMTTSYANAGASVNQTFTPGGSWLYASMTITVSDPGAALMAVWIGFANNSAIGVTADIDAVMLTEGTELRNYADGSTPGWTWSGTPHGSASSGPAV